MTRLLQGAVVVFAAASLAFVLIKLAPGDQFSEFGISPGASPAVVEYWRTMNDLNLPVAEQYWLWLTGLARGYLGQSSTQQRPVIEVIWSQAFATLHLMVLAFTSSIVFGVLLGAWQGVHAKTRRDKVASFITLVLYSMPEFWLGTALMVIFVSTLGWFPTAGMTRDEYYLLPPIARVGDRLWHIVLPWLTLTLIGTSVFARYQRSAMRETMREPFVLAARSKGVRERAVRYRHALRASLLPVVAVAGLLFPTLLTGAVFVEYIFAWPGLGTAIVDGAGRRDVPLVCAVVILGAAMTTLGALLTDLVREMVDPRTRT